MMCVYLVYLELYFASIFLDWIMSAIEEVLWNIFTFYSLNGNPRDPSRLHSMALLKMCKDIMALDQILTDTPISQADLHLIYTSVLKSPTKVQYNF